MTWNEYLNGLIERGCSYENAANIVGRQMDLYEDWEWNNKIPFEPFKQT